MAAAQAAARALGAAGWAAAELLLAIRTGMSAGASASRAAINTGGKMGDGL